MFVISACGSPSDGNDASKRSLLDLEKRIRTLREKADRFIDQEDYAAARALFTSAIRKEAGDITDKKLLASYYHTVGLADDYCGDLGSAYYCYKESARLRLSLSYKGHLLDAANCFQNLGIIDEAKGRPKLAGERYLRSYDLRVRGKDYKAAASTRVFLSGLLISQRKFFQALQELEASRGQLDRMLNEAKRAKPKDLEDIRSINLGLSETYLNLQKTYELLGRYSASRHYALLSLNLKEEFKDDPSSVAIANNNLAATYLSSGNYKKASQYFNKALGIRRELKDQIGLAESQNNLGALAYYRGKFRDAIDYLIEAAQKRRTIGNPLPLFETLITLNSVAAESGDLVLARKCLDEAWRIKDASEVPQYKAWLRFCEANFSFRSGHPRLALTQLNECAEAVRLTLAGKDVSEVSKLYAQINEDLYRTGISKSLLPSVTNYLGVLTELEAASRELSSPVYVGEFYDASQRDLYGKVASMAHQLVRRDALRLARSFGCDDANQLSLYVLERGRAQGLVRQAAEILQHESEKLSQRLMIKIAEQERLTKAAEFGEAKNVYVQVPSVVSRNEYLQARKSYNRSVERAQGVYERAHPEVKRLLAGLTPSSALVKSVLRRSRSSPGTAIIVWNLRESDSERYTVSDGEIIRTPLEISFNNVRWGLNCWQKAILKDDRKAEWFFAGYLFRGLFQGVPRIAGKSSVRSVVVVATGGLAGLPFAALRDSNGQRLIERFELRSVESLAALVWSADREEARSRLSTEKALKPLVAASFSPPFPIVVDGHSLPVIEEVSGEVDAVSSLFPGSICLKQNQSTRAAVLKLIGNAELFHFAGHTVNDNEEGLRSSLILSSESAAWDRVSASDLLRVPLRAKLVVLSACRSGLGEPTSSEGPIGLMWALRAAGARSVVSTLWAVDDDVASSFMLGFYAHIKSGTSLERSFHLGVLELMRRRPQPRHWAPYMLMGGYLGIEKY